MAQNLGDVKRKIRSLLALAALGSGATEPERATAQAMANKLMEKFKIPEPLHEVLVVVDIGADGRFGFALNDSTPSTTGGFGYGY